MASSTTFFTRRLSDAAPAIMPLVSLDEKCRALDYYRISSTHGPRMSRRKTVKYARHHEAIRRCCSRDTSLETSGDETSRLFIDSIAEKRILLTRRQREDTELSAIGRTSFLELKAYRITVDECNVLIGDCSESVALDTVSRQYEHRLLSISSLPSMCQCIVRWLDRTRY